MHAKHCQCSSAQEGKRAKFKEAAVNWRQLKVHRNFAAKGTIERLGQWQEHSTRVNELKNE